MFFVIAVGFLEQNILYSRGVKDRVQLLRLTFYGKKQTLNL